MSFDEATVRAVNAWAQVDAVAAVGWFLSSAWVPGLVFATLGIIFLYRRRYSAIFAVALAAGGADLLTARVLKPAFGRPRPCHTLDGLVRVVSCGTGKSFPSGHASVAFAVLVSAAPSVRLGWWVLGPLSASVAGSRVLLGVHYLSDVMAGAAVGSAVGLAASRLARRRSRAANAETTAAGPS